MQRTALIAWGVCAIRIAPAPAGVFFCQEPARNMPFLRRGVRQQKGHNDSGKGVKTAENPAHFGHAWKILNRESTRLVRVRSAA